MEDNTEVHRINELLSNLSDHKMKLIRSLITYEEEFDSRCSKANSAEEWLNALPIQSLRDIDTLSTDRRTNLGDLKIRSHLRKKSEEAIIELRSVERDIKIAQLDLLSAKLNLVTKDM